MSFWHQNILLRKGHLSKLEWFSLDVKINLLISFNFIDFLKKLTAFKDKVKL